MRLSYIALLWLLSASLGACAPSGPELRILGVVDSARRAPGPETQAVRVFLEVVNPGERELALAHMEYELDAPGWGISAGEMGLAHSIPGQSSTVIELPLTLTRPDQAARADAADMSYTLKARLFGPGNRLARSWRVRASGRLASGQPTHARASRVALSR